jgi:ubiquitin C-terminal hydrolase
MSSGGLGNLGLTCAINALIQCITHTPSLRKFFIDNTFENSTLAYQFKDVIELLYVKQVSVAPKALLKKLYEFFPNNLRHGEQHDICELWMLISEKIAEEVGYTIPAPPKTLDEDPNNIDNKLHHVFYQCNNKKMSKWIEYIQGVQISILQCKNKACVEKYFNPELFTTLTVDTPIDKTSNLSDLLLDFYKIDEMTDWKCDKCKQISGAFKQSKLFKLPKVLIIVIKRFYMTENGIFQKIQNGITISDDLEFKFNNEEYKYKLRSFGNHLGSYNGGHYTATINTNEYDTTTDDTVTNDTSDPEQQSSQWLYYDDTQVTRLNNPQFHSNREVYILFYETTH